MRNIHSTVTQIQHPTILQFGATCMWFVWIPCVTYCTSLLPPHSTAMYLNWVGDEERSMDEHWTTFYFEGHFRGRRIRGIFHYFFSLDKNTGNCDTVTALGKMRNTNVVKLRWKLNIQEYNLSWPLPHATVDHRESLYFLYFVSYIFLRSL